MQSFVLFLLASTSSVSAAFAPSYSHHHHGAPCYTMNTRNKNVVGRIGSASIVSQTMANNDNEESAAASSTEENNNNNNMSTSSSDGRYDVSKLVGSADGDGGEGFNQFDPVLSATGFLSRRFGIVGGLAVFGGLFLVEGKEILKGFADATPDQGSGETITTASGLKVTEILVGKGGSAPLPGYIVGLRAVVKIGDKVIYETSAGEKPVAFKYGQRPFQNIICEGVEEGIRGMKVGGKRILEVPAALAPPGVDLPPGVSLTYEIELTEVLSGYF